MLKSCSRISSIKTRRCLLQALVLPFFPCPHSPDPAALGSGAPLGTCPHQGGLSGSHLLLVTSSRDKAEAGRVWLTAPQGQMPQPTGRETGKGQPHEAGHPPGWGGGGTWILQGHKEAGIQVRLMAPLAFAPSSTQITAIRNCPTLP